MTKSKTDLCHFQEENHLSFAIQDSDFIGHWVFHHSSFHPDLLHTNQPLPTWVSQSEPQDLTHGTSKTTSSMSHVGHGAGTTRRHTWDIQRNRQHVTRGTRGRNHKMSHVGTSTVRRCTSHVGQGPNRISLGFRHSSFQPSLLRPKLPLSMWHAGPNLRMSTPPVRLRSKIFYPNPG